MSPSKEPQLLIVTIDGPAGTGKSTVARMLARRLGMDFLDTGAMYRCAALLAIEREIDPADGPALAAAIAEAGIGFDWSSDPPLVLLGGREVSERIRTLDVSEIVSTVAASPELRQALVEQQRHIARAHPRLVTEGRDQGSVVFPDAPLRFYLDAPVEIRARRRAAQLRRAQQEVIEEEVVQDIIERDRKDAGRADGPLVRPAQAIEIDTGHLTAEQVVDEMERIARDRLPKAALSPPSGS